METKTCVQCNNFKLYYFVSDYTPRFMSAGCGICKYGIKKEKIISASTIACMNFTEKEPEKVLFQTFKNIVTDTNKNLKRILEILEAQ